MSARAEILSLLNGVKLPSPPVFSGLIHVTVEGLQSEGLSLHEVHHDARKMAQAAASTHRLSDVPSATMPLDLCVPAEMLGAELTYEGEGFPQVRRALVERPNEIGEMEAWEAAKGRLEIVCEAIRLVKEDAGNDVVISGMIPGPYTLLLYLCNPMNLFTGMKNDPQAVLNALLRLSSFLSNIGNAYKEAGADFITVHEMGGSPGFIGPAKFERFVLPALRELHASLPAPRVLSVCGNTNKSLGALADSGAEAISVDQLTDLTAARSVLKDVLLFGNIDPVETLMRGDEARVAEAAARARGAGVDAVWPGCDLVPNTPVQNLRALIAS
jgi:[methyl-Co(III) methanol-specific corrinoid protein]:coenzyme M methyltransferase